MDEDFKLSNLKKEEFKLAFDQFDLDGDGIINSEELANFMKSLGQEPTHEELNEMFEDALGGDAEDNSEITYDQFNKLIEKRLNDNDIMAEVIEAFKMIAGENSKYITVKDIKNKMKESGETLPDAELEKLLRAATNSGSDVIEYETFVKKVLTD